MFAHLQRSPKVHDLVVKFLTDVNAGIYDLEKSLPPVRAVAKTYGVSIFTVHRAFDELKKAGLIRAEGKRASYVNGDQLETLNRDNGNGTGGRVTGQEVTLLVRQYSDLRKLGTALLRENFYQHLKKLAPEITTREIQTDLIGGAFHMKLLNMMISEAYPTSGLLTQSRLDSYSSLNLLAPFHNGELDDYLKDLKPVFKNICSRNGKLFLVPNSVTYSFVLYNKKVFAEMGADPADINSWGTFYDFMIQLRERKKIPYPMALGLSIDMMYMLLCFIYQSSDCLVSGSVAPQIDWVYPKIKVGMDFFHKLVFAGKLINPINSEIDLVPKLINGVIPMCLDCGHTAEAVMRCGETGLIGIMPLPRGPNGVTMSLSNVSGFFINAKASPPEKKAGVKYISHWLRWINGKESVSLFKEYKRSHSLFSLRENKSASFHPGEEIPEDWSRALARIEENAVFEHTGSDWEKELAADVFNKLFADGTKVSAAELALYLNSYINNSKLREEEL